MLPRFLQLLTISTTLLLTACGGASQPPRTGVAQYALRPGEVGYRLPVVGSWRVHRTHYGAKGDQAYAVDLVLDTPLPPGPHRDNTVFPSYNQPVVADAPGVVVIAVDGIPDSPPGVVNRYDMHGNFVVIDHQNGEYSLMAHLIPGSLKVRKGQPVVAGSEIGRCGNSGQTTMPHLHWQIMTDANASIANGIPPRLLMYTRNGSPSSEIPQKGDKLYVQ